MKIRVTESVGEVFRTIEVENPAEEVTNFLIGKTKEDSQKQLEGFSNKVVVEEPKSIIFDQTKYGSSICVECNYDSYKWAKESQLEEIVYIKITNGGNAESASLSLEKVKTLHKYLGEVINYMES